MSTTIEVSEAEIKACILEAIPKKVSLHYTHYDESFEHCIKDFQPILKGELNIWEVTDQYYDNAWVWDNEHDAIDEIKSTYVKPALRKLFDDEYASSLVADTLSEWDDFICEICHERDDSTPIKDLLSHTRSQPAIGILWSNEEGLRSNYHYYQYGYEYDGYFKMVLDTLQLNPAVVKQALFDRNYKTSGRWPNKSKRQPYVDITQFMVELENTASQCNMLSFLGLIDLSELEGFTGKAVIPAGNCCGFFDPACGSGSVLEIELLRDFVIDTKKKFETAYDHFGLHFDKALHYSVNDVYGPTRQFWGKEMKLC